MPRCVIREVYRELCEGLIAFVLDHTLVIDPYSLSSKASVCAYVR